MIIPSVDLMGGEVVQLVGGRDLALTAGEPTAWVDRFAVAGEVAVVDLDAALGHGDQRAVIAPLCRRAPCRVGGGIRDVARARAWLDAGAAKIVIGTAASATLLRALPRERVIVALDGVGGEVLVDGWRTPTGRRILDRVAEWRDLVSGFLVTFVDREGRMAGTDLNTAREVAAAAGPARVTVAGGVTTAAEVARLDAMGVDAQVGMALYTGRLALADAIAAPLATDRADGLVATVVADERGTALGLAWSSRESLARAVAERRGIYHSRRRGVWSKGASSGAIQELLRVDLDCDRDALRFTVRQQPPGFCHTGSATCWGAPEGVTALETTIGRRREERRDGAYTSRLLADDALLRAKLREEAAELGAAHDRTAVVHEAADLLYFLMVKLGAADVAFAEVEAELTWRSRRVTRRAGDAKPLEEATA